jgi:hypothetical protein
MLTWKSRAISRMVERRAVPSVSGILSLAISGIFALSCLGGTPGRNQGLVSCWGFVSIATSDCSMLTSYSEHSDNYRKIQLKSVIL